MNSKTTIGLVAAVLVAVVGFWWATSSEKDAPPKQTPNEPKPLFEPALADLVGFESNIRSQPTFEFEKVNDKWRMRAPLSGPAEHYIVNSDAQQVKDLKYVKAFAKDDPDRPSEESTSLNDPLRKVKLVDKNGKQAVVKIGERQKLSKRTYVQVEGDDRIYLVETDLLGRMKKRLADYRGKQPVEIAQNDAVRIEVEGQQAFTLVKSDGEWVIEAPIKARAAQAKAGTLVSGLANLRVQNFVEDEAANLRIYGLDKPQAVVAVTTETKTLKEPTSQGAEVEGPVEPQFDVKLRTVRVAFGATVDEKVFARLPDEPQAVVFQVSAAVLKNLVPELAELRDKRVTPIATSAVNRIAVRQGDQAIELVKSEGKWRIEGASGSEGASEAEFAAVDDLLKAVRDLNAVGFEDQMSPAFGLSDPRVTIELTAEGKIGTVKLLIGGPTLSKTGVYVLNEGDGHISVVSSDSVDPLLISPHAFMSRDMLKVARIWARKIDLVRSDQSFTLELDAGAWHFVAPVKGVALSPAVETVFADLANLRGRRVVGLSADAASYGLDKPSMRVCITSEPPPEAESTSQPADAAATPTTSLTVQTLLINKHTDDKVYAMVEGGGTICEIDGKVYDDLGVEFFDPKVVSVDPSQVRGLGYGGDEAFEFDKSGDAWKLNGEPSFPVNESKITEVLNTLRDLRAERFVQYNGAVLSEFGLGTPALEITLRDGEGVSTTVKIASTGSSDANRYAVVSAAADRVFLVAAAEVEKLTKSVADFRSGS